MTREELEYVLNNLKVDNKYIGRYTPFRKYFSSEKAFYRLAFGETLILEEDYLVVNICTTDGYVTGTMLNLIINYRDLFVYIDQYACIRDDDAKAVCLSTYDSCSTMYEGCLGCVDKDFRVPKIKRSIDE